MDRQQVETICDTRLGSWKKRLVQSQATPIALLGMGHDWNSGKLIFCTTEDMPTDQIILTLLSAAKSLLEAMPGQLVFNTFKAFPEKP